MSKTENRDVVVNRKARHDFNLSDSFEVGLQLLGSEVKSLRAGNANLRDAHVQLRGDGAWLMGLHISPYIEAHQFNHDPLRPRKLLLHRHELSKLQRAIQQKGMTIVPLRIYRKGSLFKAEIALAKGKKLHDKRESLKAKDAERDMHRVR